LGARYFRIKGRTKRGSLVVLGKKGSKKNTLQGRQVLVGRTGGWDHVTAMVNWGGGIIVILTRKNLELGKGSIGD